MLGLIILLFLLENFCVLSGVLLIIVPIKVYDNADLQKLDILKDNRK